MHANVAAAMINDPSAIPSNENPVIGMGANLFAASQVVCNAAALSEVPFAPLAAIAPYDRSRQIVVTACNVHCPGDVARSLQVRRQ